MPTYNEKEYLTPFWSTDTMYNESVLMVSPDSVSPAEASLLFPPLSIISVKDASLETNYIENIDWIYTNGKLRLLPGSKAVFMTNSQLYPITKGATMDKIGGGYVLFHEGHFFHDKQLAITYTHEKNVWKGPVPKYAGINLPNTTKKLIQGEPLKIVFYGNSITVGGNASGVNRVAPYMPNYAGLVVNKLKSTYSSAITMKNSAVGGKDAAWGLANVHSLVTLENPDLVVLSFGMNDGTGKVSPAVFKSRIESIINDVRATNPNSEFILVATTLANPETFFAGQQVNYKPVLQELAGSGTELADMTGVHQELLKNKLFRDMTGNNINHSNDFLHRWYAQQICGLLIPSSATTNE
ncbi:MAG: hypothetical protein A2W90_15320 [Bacteroidetes bacterium GWF2_42_66]|nr:MAG: hypothetical protein A2W92_07095 [Bacteroidetes bacterium GWA2_42_15]OFX96959.1 MAG: hypothetical protein A2W89_19815 [Bacteroidetes bacterium GWE2_42_39]OFY46873.1 MAG: hypothetical protein A2W90_15320 [Bacteroidetes bacterium GWF2_42_66]